MQHGFEKPGIILQFSTIRVKSWRMRDDCARWERGSLAGIPSFVLSGYLLVQREAAVNLIYIYSLEVPVCFLILKPTYVFGRTLGKG